MLFINYKGDTPQQRFYTIGVQQNSNANKVRFIVAQQQADVLLTDDYDIYIKVNNKEKDYIDKIKATDYDFVDGNIEIDWTLTAKSTQYRNLEVQLQFENGDDVVVWQTLIIELELNNTIKADEEIEDKYPSVLMNLQKEVDDLDENKQDKLVSGENIKTINSQSILGSGNITIEGAEVPLFIPTYWSGETIVFSQQDYKDIYDNEYQTIKLYDGETTYSFKLETKDEYTDEDGIHIDLRYICNRDGSNAFASMQVYFNKLNSNDYSSYITDVSLSINSVVKTSGDQTITGKKTFVNQIRLALSDTDENPIIVSKATQKFSLFYGSASSKMLEASVNYLDTPSLEPLGTNPIYNIGRNTNLKRYNYVYCKSVDANASVETPRLYTTSITKQSNDGEYPYIYFYQDNIKIGNGNDGDLLSFDFGSNVVQKSIYPSVNNSVELGSSSKIWKNVYTNKIGNSSKEIEVGDLSIHHTYTPTSYDFATQSITFTTEQLTDIWDRDLDEINIVFGSDTYTYKKVDSWTDGSSYELIYECLYKPQSRNYTIHSAIYLMFDGSSYSYGFMYKTLNPQTSYYTKTETDNLIATLRQNSFQDVDTTTYPTLNDFLASTGEEGYIYLYPIDTADLTKGYHQYIWESSSWRFLGDTNIDLTNYVDLTSAQTITGKKSFSGNIDVSNEINFSNGVYSGIIKWANTTILSLNSNAGIQFYATPRPATNGGKDLGALNYKWNNLYLAGSLRDGNNADYGLALPDTTSYTANKTIATTDDLTNYVDKTSAQEISGAKTFTTAVLLKNNVGIKYGNSYSNGYTICNDGSGGLLFKNNYNVSKYHFTDSYFYPDVSGANSLGTLAKCWDNTYTNRISDDVATRTPKGLAGATSTPTIESNSVELPYDTIAELSLDDDTTITLPTTTGCLPEYKANITNSGASPIIITFPSGTIIKTNDTNITISSNTMTLPVSTSVELNLQNGHAIAYNWNI